MHQPVDVDYLRSLGLAERVEGWQKFFEESLNRKS
jgi:hypothetical protein